MKLFTHNKKAYYEYSIIQKYETGVVLKGSEPSAIRNGSANLSGTFAKIINEEVILFNMFIGALPSEKNKHLKHIRKSFELQRERKLLLHKKEILKLSKHLKEDGLTLIPLSIYANERNVLKVELALCKGKKSYDKKQSIKERDLDIEMKRNYK